MTAQQVRRGQRGQPAQTATGATGHGSQDQRDQPVLMGTMAQRGPRATGTSGDQRDQPGQRDQPVLMAQRAQRDRKAPPGLMVQTGQTAKTQRRTASRRAAKPARRLTANDKGKSRSTTGNITVPASVFSAGDAITIYNSNTSTDISIPQGSGATWCSLQVPTRQTLAPTRSKALA